jgi:ubiquinone biosynthesis protein UbiJ
MNAAEAVCLAALDHLLEQAGWARERLRPYAGRHVRLDLAPFALAFAVTGDGTLAASPADAAPEVTLALPLAEALAALGSGWDAAMTKVRVSGSADLADALAFVFRHLRWDIEEDLAKFTGDIAAHRLVTGGKRLAEAPRRLAAAKNSPFTAREEGEQLVRDIQALEADLAKLEARAGLLWKENAGGDRYRPPDFP